MSFIKSVCLMMTLLLVFSSSVLAESTVKEGVVVEYTVDTDVGSAKSGSYSIEIKNSNAYDVELMLHVYSMVTAKAFGAVLCNADYLKTIQIQAGEALKVVEQNCQATRRGKYEYDVNIMNVKKIEAPPQPVSQESIAPPVPEIEADTMQAAPPVPQKTPEIVTQEKPESTPIPTPAETPISAVQPPETPAEAAPISAPLPVCKSTIMIRAMQTITCIMIKNVDIL